VPLLLISAWSRHPTASGNSPANFREVARTLLTIGTNRLELLRVEVQEERVLLMQAIFLAFGAGAFGLLWGITLTGMVVFLFLTWHRSR
jgi:uncharacterized membrane protein YqjE